VLQDLGHREGQAATWHSLGYAHHGLADHQQAAICFERALDLYTELGDRYSQASTLTSLGDVHDSAGDIIAARRAWMHALPIFDEIGHSDGDRLRAKLRLPGDQQAS